MVSPRLARFTLRTGLAAATATALTVGSLAATPAANAAPAPPTPGPYSNPYSPALHHPYRHGAVPTRAAADKMNSYRRAHPLALPSLNNLSYGGGIDGIGVTSGREKVYLVFYGLQWGSTGTDANGNTTLSDDPKGLAPYMQSLLRGWVPTTTCGPAS
jgi:serine protease